MSGAPQHPRTPLGSRIQRACDHAGLSLRQCARDVGLTSNQLTRIVRGHRAIVPWHDIVAIALRCGVSLDFLAGRTEYVYVVPPLPPDPVDTDMLDTALYALTARTVPRA